MKNIIISPSGNLYGSENVLFDFLKTSEIRFDYIFVPKNSLFQKKLNFEGFLTKDFFNVKSLYFKLFLILVTKKINCVYCNESGHVRYINILSWFFPSVKFIIHVRIIEDTKRVVNSSNNQKVVSISKTISCNLKIKSVLIYDGYNFGMLNSWQRPKSEIIKIGIVGRITESKGIGFFSNENLEKFGTCIEFHFFGDLDKKIENSTLYQNLNCQSNVFFHGFIKEKNHIYDNIHLLLHVNENEPLGRIFFESLDYGIPFIGIKGGGISEISEIINYPYVFAKEEIASVIYKLTKKEWEIDFVKLENSRNKAIVTFSIDNYSHRIDRLIIV